MSVIQRSEFLSVGPTKFLERARATAFVVGSALLFWQHDGAAVDWVFLTGIGLSFLLWLRGRPALDLGWPQSLVIVFLGATGAATAFAGGDLRAFAISAYLGVASLALASAMKQYTHLRRYIARALIVAAGLTVITVCVGFIARQLGIGALEFMSYDALRSRGLFKDPNVAGGFLAASYPLAAAFCIRWRERRTFLLVVMTLAFAAGVILSFSRLALFTFGLAFASVLVALVILRERGLAARTVTSLLACVGLVVLIVVLVVGVGHLPLDRYQPIQSYDQTGRFVVWSYAPGMFAAAPFGSGAGSFETRARERFLRDLGITDSALVLPSALPFEVAAGLHGHWVGQSAYPALRPGEISRPITVLVRNTGTLAWDQGVGTGTALGIEPTGLLLRSGELDIAGFSGLQDLTPTTMNVGWPSYDRVARSEPRLVPSGAIAQFSFRVRAPQSPGTYVLYLRPVTAGGMWLEDDGIFVQMSVYGTPVEHGAPTATPESLKEPIAPLPPTRYDLPAAALHIGSSAALVAALDDKGTPRDIVLADGIYDNTGPFLNPNGHRLYAEHLGGAVLRAGISLGGNSGPGKALVRGIAFDVSDAAKTAQNSIVHVWGTGAGSRILDSTFNGNRAIGAAIVARQVEGLVVQRVRVRDFTSFGVLADPNQADRRVITTPLLEDLDIVGILRTSAGETTGGSEVCLSTGITVIVRRATLRNCASAGVWTGSSSVGSLFEQLDIEESPTGIYLDGGTSHASFRDVRIGGGAVGGVVASPSAMRAPIGTPAGRPLTVTPAAHNTYLRVAVESGAIGALALFAYFGLLLRRSVQRSQRDSWEWPLAFALVLISGVAIDTLHWRQLWIYVGVIAATMTTFTRPAATTVDRWPAQVGRGLEEPPALLATKRPKVSEWLPDRDAEIVRAEEVVAQRIAAYGRSNVAVAAALHLLATLWHSRGEHENAAALYDDARRIYEEKLGSADVQLVWLLEDLAALRREQGARDEARVLYANALEILERTGPDDGDVIARKRAEYDASSSL